MYQALYRKWRSRTFDDVVGQEHITTTLKNQVAQGKPSHAYLFCGTRGTGKTSCSKILAKAVNCPNQHNGNPCCECDICRGIDTDSILDVTEIDAASNSGVDNIRELREEAGFTPVSGDYRVYIIDECHMLSTGAFNALLKIMEEPPAHVLFILATTEIHKVPATIMSRCQRFDFKRIPSETIAGHLLHIAREEQIDLSPDAAMLIARLSDGAMRDSISLFDLCLSSGEAVTIDTVHACAGLADRSYLFDVAEAAINSDSAKALEILGTLWEDSIDYQRFCEQLQGFFRNLMVAKSVQKPDELLTCLPGELEQYREMAERYPMERIFYCLSVLEETQQRMGRTAQRRIELEMGMLKLCDPALGQDYNNLVSRLDKLERLVKSGNIPSSATPAAATDPADSVGPAVTVSPTTPVEIFEQWPQVLEALAPKNRALYGTLANSKAYVAEGGLLLVDAGDSLFSQMVRTDQYARQSLRDAALAATGQKYRLGPYQADKYEVKPATAKLDAILEGAAALGVDLQIKE